MRAVGCHRARGCPSAQQRNQHASGGKCCAAGRGTHATLFFYSDLFSYTQCAPLRRRPQALQLSLAAPLLPCAADKWLQALLLDTARLPSEAQEEAFLLRRAAGTETSEEEADRCLQQFEALARRVLRGASGMDIVIQQLHHRLRKWLQGRPEERYAPVPWRSMLELSVCAIAAHAPPDFRHCAVHVALDALQHQLNAFSGRGVDGASTVPGTPRQHSPPPTRSTVIPSLDASTFYVDGFLKESNEAPLSLQLPLSKRSMTAREGGEAAATDEPQVKRPALSSLRVARSDSASAALMQALQQEQQQQRSFEVRLGALAISEGAAGSQAAPSKRTPPLQTTAAAGGGGNGGGNPVVSSKDSSLEVRGTVA